MATKIYATGRRKASVAKVWLTPGSGKITINGLSLDAWLGGLEAKKLRVKQPLVLSKQDSSVDIVATTIGGGFGAARPARQRARSKRQYQTGPTRQPSPRPAPCRCTWWPGPSWLPSARAR